MVIIYEANKKESKFNKTNNIIKLEKAIQEQGFYMHL
jgi:uncharacterized protein YcgL (UPF0745 family)